MGGSARRWGRLGALLVVGSAGCNLLTGAADLSVDPNGSTPGGDGGTASADGGADAPGPTEGGLPKEAGSDGAGTAPGCAPGLTFCDDFDGAGGLGKWGLVKIGGGNAAIDSVASFSAPSSLLLTWPTGTDANSTKGVELQADIGVTPLSVVLSAAVRAEAASVPTDKSTLTLLTLAFGSTYAIAFEVGRNGNLQVTERRTAMPGGTTSSTTSVSGRLTATDFQTVEITLKLDPPGTATFTLDGKPAGSKGLSPVTPLGALRLVVGDADVAGNTTDWRVRFDNVSVLAK